MNPQIQPVVMSDFEAADRPHTEASAHSTWPLETWIEESHTFLGELGFAPDSEPTREQVHGAFQTVLRSGLVQRASPCSQEAARLLILRAALTSLATTILRESILKSFEQASPEERSQVGHFFCQQLVYHPDPEFRLRYPFETASSPTESFPDVVRQHPHLSLATLVTLFDAQERGTRAVDHEFARLLEPFLD